MWLSISVHACILHACTEIYMHVICMRRTANIQICQNAYTYYNINIAQG